MPTMTPGEAAAFLRRFKFGTAASQWADEVSPGIVAAMRFYAPKGRQETGRTAGRTLERSIYAKRFTTTTGIDLVVGSDVPQARYVLEGTRPHLIQGRPLLAFTWRSGTSAWMAATGGQNVLMILRSVQHPGTKPNPFNRKAWNSVSRKVTDLFRERIAAAFEET